VTATGRDTIKSLREDLVRVRRDLDVVAGERDAARVRVRELEAELVVVGRQLAEALKLAELQKADLDRLRDLHEKTRPNSPERVPRDEADLAFERVLETFGDAGAANDEAKDDEGASGEAPSPDTKGKKRKRRDKHGRRRLDLTKLPLVVVEIDPPEVKAAGREGFVRIGEEVSERLGFRPASYFRLRIVRGKWVRDARAGGGDARVLHESDAEQAIPGTSAATADVGGPPPVLVALLPDNVWPDVMADPSAVAQNIIAKYDDVLPLNRQERISGRHGFPLPRSTQCGWLGLAYLFLRRIVVAMFQEARATAFCIATDATGAPVRKKGGGTEKWHVFVFTADRDHVVFTYAPEHTSVTASSFLKGFRGHVLADASAIFDVLFRDEGMTETGCWFHARRYFWRALETDRERALEAIAMIAKLFEIDRKCHDIPMPDRTAVRARRAKPILAMLDAWVERHRRSVDPRGPLDKAIGYYTNQRAALRRFLDDGRLPLDNSVSERGLKNLVLGRLNWLFFANETGLRWYTTFRSLIASCALHGLNPQEYLEQVLRLAPHWSITRMLELAPKYWANTKAGLDAHQREIIARPWETADAVLEMVATLSRAA
jgi:transposase